MADLTVADPVAITVGWLKTRPRVLDALGGPDHISGLNEAPWPHVLVTPGAGGDLRNLLWDTQHEVTLEVHDSPEGTTGRAALWRLTMLLAQEMSALAEEWRPQPGDPGVSESIPSGTFAWSPLVNGQGRWIVGFLLVVHP